ncbi:MAG: PLP-dependent transferase, partial [Vicinamibacterales bacterium]|nr:PLP-dependent transferase [Vicinamibacterales bacterium]
DPEVLRLVTSGYPRFVVHPFSRELGSHLARGDPALAGRALWLTSSDTMAARLIEHLGPAGDARLYDGHGVVGVSHPESSDLSGRAKTFLQHIGGFVSSRQAEDHLVRLGLRAAAGREALFDGDGAAEAVRQLASVLPGTTGADLFLANNGMNAIHAAFRAVSDLQTARGRTVWLQLGWLYLDTIAILQTFTAAAGDYIYVRDVFDFRALDRLFAQHGSRLAGVVAEVPTNPLVQTPDLPALAALCRRHGARLLVDPSMASVYNVDVLAHADVVVSSLTKYTGHDGDLTAGLAAVNPQGADAAALRAGIASWYEPLYARDATRLAREIADTPAVLARILTSTPRVVAFLEQHPAVGEVFWALHPASRAHYLTLARTPDAVSGVITFTLREPGSLARVYDRLRLPKGPSFGMKTTLVCPFMYLAHYDLVTTPAGRARLAADGLDPDLIRLCVGTEPVDEIIAALDEALG